MAKEIKCEKCGEVGVCVDDKVGKLKKGGTYMCKGCLKEQIELLQDALGSADVSAGDGTIIHIHDSKC